MVKTRFGSIFIISVLFISAKYGFANVCILPDLNTQPFFYTANFYPMKTTGSGNYGVPAGGKPALSMEKGCKNHKETLCMLWINPVIFTDCGEPQENYRISLQS